VPGYRILVTLVSSGLVCSLIALRLANLPYLWIFPCWFICFLVLALFSKIPAIKAAWFNASVACITMTAIEGYWLLQPEQNISEQYTGTYTNGYFLKHDLLGHAPPKNTEITSTRSYQNRILYDVVYTLDQNGLRIAPPSQDNAKECLLFFGGSYTFGEGVGDEEAMPYRVGLLSNGRYRVYNFGFHAYGPHQMLAALEHGLVSHIIECQPRYIIYLGMVAHVARSAGLVPWEYHGPWYELQSDGHVSYSGRFDEQPKNRFITRLRIETTEIYQRIFGKKRAIRQKDIALYLAIIDAARNITKKAYPESEFHMLFWGDDGDRTYHYVLKALREMKIAVHPLSEIIPFYANEKDRYRISPYDDHPNALGHDLMARYVADRLSNR